MSLNCMLSIQNVTQDTKCNVTRKNIQCANKCTTNERYLLLTLLAAIFKLTSELFRKLPIPSGKIWLSKSNATHHKLLFGNSLESPCLWRALQSKHQFLQSESCLMAMFPSHKSAWRVRQNSDLELCLVWEGSMPPEWFPDASRALQHRMSCCTFLTDSTKSFSIQKRGRAGPSLT